MLAHLIRKEILDHLLGFRFLILSVLSSLIIWLSLFSGYGYYQNVLAEYRETETLKEARLQRIEAFVKKTATPDYLPFTGYPIQKPPTPLSIFVRGLDPTLGRTGGTAGKETIRLRYSPAAEDPALGIFPALDLGIVVQFVLGLFVLLLTYNAVCGEKEAGTLSLTSSFPVPKDRFLLSKIIGALVPVLIAFLLPMILGASVLLALPDVQFKTSELIRIGMIILIFGLYLAALTCAGVLGSSLTHRASTSFVILLFFWVGTAAILPRLSLIVADMFRPAPSTQQFLAERLSIRHRTNQERYKRQDRWVEEYTAKTGKSPWETREGRKAHLMMLNREMAEMTEKQREPAFGHLKTTFQNRYNARHDLASLLARLSPAFALNNATIRLTGTDIDRHRRFYDAYVDLRNRNADWMLRERTKAQLSRIEPDKHEKYAHSALPRLEFQEPDLQADIQSAMMDVVMLALWCLLFFLGAYVALLRYDWR